MSRKPAPAQPARLRGVTTPARMTSTGRVRHVLARAVAVLLSVLLAALATAPAAVPAWAHGGDPTLVPSVTEIRPQLPGGVVVQVRTGLSEQMVVANPIDVPLTILDPEGNSFLRLSSAGVFGNVAVPYFHATANPPDVPPRLPSGARPGAPPRWVQVSEGDSWGWFERRLHPFAPGAEPGGGRPGETAEREVLASWEVGMRYGDRPVTAAGVLERRPVLGTFRATADPVRAPLRVSVAQGQLPALLLVAPDGATTTVMGSDGAPFLRVGRRGVTANSASPQFRDNPRFQTSPPGRDGWVQVSEGSSATWVDSRLSYRADRPPDDVVESAEITQLGRWSIPVTVDGQQRTLSGAIEWIPSAEAAALVGAQRPDSGFPWAMAALGVGALALLAAVGGLALRSRQRAGG